MQLVDVCTVLRSRTLQWLINLREDSISTTGLPLSSKAQPPYNEIIFSPTIMTGQYEHIPSGFKNFVRVLMETETGRPHGAIPLVEKYEQVVAGPNLP